MLFLDLIGSLIGSLLGQSFMDWQNRDRNGVDGRTECGLRVVSGQQPGLTLEWAYDRSALVRPGRITFRDAGMAVKDVVAESRRLAFMGETRFRVQADIVRIRTESATLELTLVSGLMAWALERLGQDAARP